MVPSARSGSWPTQWHSHYECHAGSFLPLAVRGFFAILHKKDILTADRHHWNKCPEKSHLSLWQNQTVNSKKKSQGSSPRFLTNQKLLLPVESCCALELLTSDMSDTRLVEVSKAAYIAFSIVVWPRWFLLILYYLEQTAVGLCLWIWALWQLFTTLCND